MRKKIKSSSVILDKLKVSSFIFLIRSKDINEVNILEAKMRFHKIMVWILSKQKKSVKILSIFAGDYFHPNGDSISFYSQKIATKIALEESDKILESSLILKKANLNLKRNTVKLIICRKMYHHIYPIIFLYFLANALSKKLQITDLVLEGSTWFDLKSQLMKFDGIKVHIYKNKTFVILNLLKMFAYFLLRNLKHYLISKFDRADTSKLSPSNQGTVLSIQEDTIRFNNNLRNQPFWVDRSKPLGSYQHIILRNPSTYDYEVENLNALENLGVYVAPYRALWKKNFSKHDKLKDIELIKKSIYLGILKKNTLVEKFLFFELLKVLKDSKKMGIFSIRNKVKVFLFSDSYQPLTISMLLIAPLLKIKTLSFQYSNLGRVSLDMLNTSDTQFLFSDSYKKIFSCLDISPRSFLLTGYINNHLIGLLKKNTIIQKEKLKSLGVEFTISFFNERYDIDKFGLISKEDYFSEISSLLELLLKHADIALIIKTQFINSKPSYLFPDSKLISDAIKTGRYIELNNDNINSNMTRNDIYPAQAALASDIAINHKFGATAGLESAVNGIRTVLLNKYKITTKFDKTYAQANIEFDSMNSMLNSIIKYKEGDLKYQDLGDWSKVLDSFHHKSNQNAIEIIRDEIDNSMLNQKSVP